MSCISYNDTVRLIDPDVDEYGTEIIGTEANVPAIIGQATGWSHAGNQDAITSATVAYLDPTNTFVSTHFNRLEGMLVVARLFGVNQADAWFRITDVTVGRDVLLCNQIDNIQVTLSKSTEMPSNVS